MEIDVTHMVEESDNMMELSGSRCEHGQDAGRITWNNSVAYGRDKPLLATDDMRDAARAHLREYGAWSEEEIAAWSEDELQGIICQDIAAAIRESPFVDGEPKDDGGRLFKGDNGRWYFYLGS